MSTTESAATSPKHLLRVACIGAGPGGLFAAIALAKAVPGSHIDVFERNARDNVYGFGVVFSDTTYHNINQVDSVLKEVLDAHGRHWNTIRVVSRGVTTPASGNGMSAVHRRHLLAAMSARAEQLGVHLHYATPATIDTLLEQQAYDLIVAADGTGSATRERFAERLGHTRSVATVKFIWFATPFQFQGLTFLHKQSRFGNFAVHAYPIGEGLSTFIVETDEDTWHKAGLDAFDVTQPAGPSDEKSQQFLAELFADEIDHQPLVANNSRWANFCTRRTQTWHVQADARTAVAFLGDSVHTAHFSVGSGTKMAMEDASILAQCVQEHPGDLETALSTYERIRAPEVNKIQDSALPSLSWWDHFGRYQRALPPWQFSFHFFSRAISLGKLRVRDTAFVAQSEAAWRQAFQSPPLSTPLTAGTCTFSSRLLFVRHQTAGSVQLGDGLTWIEALPVDAPQYAGYALCAAPDADTATLGAREQAALDVLAHHRPTLAVIHQGTPLSRVLASEYLKMQHGIPTLLVDDLAALRSRRALSIHDDIETLVLSGRADAVAFALDTPQP
ncbi:MAG: 2-polyprenyl-6-methoxyphenol hydroxylase [Castellaniella sp.]|uniref:FAD-dependent monooxygenase n=1 Tax=Castellaniella sp. TaxID=1955812 RepID=UPI00120930EF|nr:FAD-dependent monooxygenase [Castellaniella sp.]TAN27115.1 MAG: 2-polyprenyl-6-methoxyphenol hydroxylase [Castellaniella sp.]